MKILYLCSDIGVPVLGSAGGSGHVRGLVNAFTRAKHTVVLVTPHLNRSPWEKPAKLDVQVVKVEPGPDIQRTTVYLKEFSKMLGIENSRLPTEIKRILYNRDLLSQLRQLFNSHRPDFIYERYSLYAMAGVSLARELALPLIMEVNAPLAQEQRVYRATGLGDLAATTERWILSQASAVVVVSAPLREHVVSQGVQEESVHVLPCGVDPVMFRPGDRDPQTRERWGLDGHQVVGFVGGLRPWHGVKILPTLLSRLVQQHKDVRLMIVGDGPLRKELESELRTIGLGDNVIFTSALPQTEVAKLIPHFDLALAPYPPLDHAFYFSPLKLFEYMACGVPVVAAGVGQIAEVVRNGETGLLYPPGDVDALTSACNRLLSDASLRRRLSQAAAKEVHEQYTWDHNAARVVELARSLTAKSALAAKGA